MAVECFFFVCDGCGFHLKCRIIFEYSGLISAVRLCMA